MTTSTQPMPRRSFLTGAASLLGVASVGLAPQISRAADSRGQDGALKAHIWNGARFVPIASHDGTKTAVDQVRVSIVELGNSAEAVTVDAAMPGGIFHAYAGAGHPSGVARFTAPIEPGSSLSFTIRIGGSSEPLRVTPPSEGRSIQLGYYLIGHSSLDAETLFLAEGTDAPVRRMSGALCGDPLVLIQLSAR